MGRRQAWYVGSAVLAVLCWVVGVIALIGGADKDSGAAGVMGVLLLVGGTVINLLAQIGRDVRRQADLAAWEWEQRHPMPAELPEVHVAPAPPPAAAVKPRPPQAVCGQCGAVLELRPGERLAHGARCPKCQALMA